MAQSLLEKLPAELLAMIYQDLDTIASAVSLSLSCHSIQAVWKEHKSNISLAIAPRCVVAFDDALDLSNILIERLNDSAGERTIMMLNPASDRVFNSDLKPELALMFENAKIARKFALFFESETHPRYRKYYKSAQAHSMSQAEHERLTRYLYRTWKLMALGEEEIVSTLEESTMRTIYCLCNFSNWIVNSCTSGRCSKLDLPPKTDWYRAVEWLYNSWEEKSHRNKKCLYGWPVCADIPFSTAFVILDDWWEEYARDVPDVA